MIFKQIRNIIFYLAIASFLLNSCQKQGVKNIIFEGNFIAKDVLTVQCGFPDNVKEINYSWFASSSDGEWEKLSGICTNEIILITDYVNKFLKCEISCTLKNSDEKIIGSIITPKSVKYDGNRNTDWLRDAGFGIMVHYLKPGIAPEGGSKEWNEAVNSFDVERFASKVNQSGVGFVLFTLGQNSGYYCSPNACFNSKVGVNPGDLCSFRDLPMDLLNALRKYNIPFLLYLPSNPPISNKMVCEKFKYTFGKDSATSQFNQAIHEEMIREWSLRYGSGVKGWWFDGLYSWNNIRSTRMDMSLKHNISSHTLAAKAGNKESIVTFNSGFGEIKVNTPYCDYTSGEKKIIDELPSGRWVGDGVQWFLFTYLGEKWGGRGQQFETGELVKKAKEIVNNEGVLCLEVVTDACGEILPHHLQQVKEVGIQLGKVKK